MSNCQVSKEQKVTMSKGNYTLTLETFPDHLNNTVAKLRASSQFADVTLLCEDLQEVQAHRFILSACSNLFRKILELNKSQCIYLKGVNHTIMEALLDFMYNGKTVVREETLSELLGVAKDLGMTELNVDEEVENQPDSKMQDDSKMQEIANLDSSDEKLETKTNQVINHEMYFDIKNECPLCFKIFKESYALKKHINSIHERISHNCDECSKVFTDKANLSRHKNANHKGIKYPCHSCAFVGSYRGSLMTHIKSKHDNK